MTKSNLSIRWRQFEGKALYAYHRLITRTSRWHFIGKANLTQARASGRPVLWTTWHGQVMPFMMYGDRFENARRFSIIIVGDERGDSLMSLGEQIGAKVHAVDMQGNPVAAGRAVLRVIQAMNKGYDSMLAPDGPDGPAYQPKRGIAVLAQKSAAAIVPVGIWTRQAYQRKRWDGYLIPGPFARLYVAFGSPIWAEKDTPTDSLLERITHALHQAMNQARTAAGTRSPAINAK
jgi:lysophospholipid acyltransferase (LPLAT)-like uncharacterized protein